MPFVTEELWQRLPRGASEGAAAPPASIMIAPYPRPADAGTEDWHNPEVPSLLAPQNVFPHRFPPLNF